MSTFLTACQLFRLARFRFIPFRFWAARKPSRLYSWYAQPVNAFLLLKRKFRLNHIQLSSHAHAVLRQAARQPDHTMIISNHVSFADPQVLFKVLHDMRIQPNWLAGIEAFEKMHGIYAWHICASGGFSIDRGLPDRQSLAAVQSILEDGLHPLVIFPEGEASYTNGILYPFQEGLAQFALKCTEKANPVQIIPLTMQYRFLVPADPVVQKAWQQLCRQLNQKRAVLGLPPVDIRNIPDRSLPTLLAETVGQSVETLIVQYTGNPPKQGMALADQIEALIIHLLASLCREHCPELLPLELPLTHDTLLSTKNRLRSTIARKAYALTPREWGTIQQARRYAETSPAWRCNFFLNALETVLLGTQQPHRPHTQRLEKIDRCMEKHQTLLQESATAGQSSQSRWKAQLHDCRRIKLLKLLGDDLHRTETAPDALTWEALDDSLTKLEILLFGQFKYRGPKSVWIDAAAPLSVQSWQLRHNHLPRKAQARPLLDEIAQHMQTALPEEPTAPLPTMADKPVGVPNKATAGSPAR